MLQYVAICCNTERYFQVVEVHRPLKSIDIVQITSDIFCIAEGGQGGAYKKYIGIATVGISPRGECIRWRDMTETETKDISWQRFD